MRRRGVAFRWSGVAIVAAQFLLHLHGADRGVDLDLIVELPIIDFGKVLNKIAGPGTAIAARGIETAFDLQRLALFDGHQVARGLQRFQFNVVLNAGQIDAVDFFVLPESGNRATAGTLGSKECHEDDAGSGGDGSTRCRAKAVCGAATMNRASTARAKTSAPLLVSEVFNHRVVNLGVISDGIIARLKTLANPVEKCLICPRSGNCKPQMNNFVKQFDLNPLT